MPKCKGHAAQRYTSFVWKKICKKICKEKGGNSKKKE